MGDPADRMQRFITSQRAKQDQEAAAKTVWCGKIPELAKVTEAIVDVLRQAGHPSAMFEIRSDQILVGFSNRAVRLSAGAEIAPLANLPEEAGADSSFQFDPESNQVVGFRRPFRTRKRAWDRFCELGDPETLTAEAFGNAVVEFLEWACVGEGRGSGKLRF
jgi:hypothetical protein